MSRYPVSQARALRHTWRRQAHAGRQTAGAQAGEHGPLGEMLAGLVALAAALGCGYRR